uniref:Uncharacterized protein n=1 Tax=Myotis myotis TaxID=51298 RepID=A0A7J7U573_MYOMY|nr:hypothetical protein mMyoMyo1_008865 [Myotis myotis]
MSEELSEREEVAGLVLRVSQEKPLQKDLGRGGGAAGTGSTAHTWCILERHGKAVSPCPVCERSSELPVTLLQLHSLCLVTRARRGGDGARPGLREERGGPPRSGAHVALAQVQLRVSHVYQESSSSAL